MFELNFVARILNTILNTFPTTERPVRAPGFRTTVPLIKFLYIATLDLSYPFKSSTGVDRITNKKTVKVAEEREKINRSPFTSGNTSKQERFANTRLVTRHSWRANQKSCPRYRCECRYHHHRPLLCLRADVITSLMKATRWFFLVAERD